MTIARFERVSPAQYDRDMTGRDAPAALDTLPLPRRATTGSAGYDFTASCTVTLAPGQSAVIPSGMRAWIEPGWVLLLFPRSSLGFKHGVRLANTVGVIDSDYYYADNEGHIMVKLTNLGDHEVTIAQGERFCQGVFVPFGTAEEEEVSAGRTGGFGSTGA